MFKESESNIHPTSSTQSLQNSFVADIAEMDINAPPLLDVIGKMRTYSIVSPEGEPTGLRFEIDTESEYESFRQFNPLQFSWTRVRGLNTVISAIDMYFQESSTSEFDNTRLSGSVSQGDIFWAMDEKTEKVTREFIKSMLPGHLLEPLEDEDKLDIGPLGSVSISGASGYVAIAGDTLSVRPNLRDDTQQTANEEAIRKLFQSTAADASLIPVFDEVIDIGFELAERKIWEATLMDGLEDEVNNSSENK